MMPDFTTRPASFARASTASDRAYPADGSRQPLQPGHGLEVVVQHVGPGVEDHGERVRIALAVGDQHLDRGVRIAVTDGADRRREPGGAAVGDVVARHARDHRVREPEGGHRLGDTRRARRGRSGTACGCRPGRTRTARVQRSPRIMKVAVRCDQHSKMFGQPASSHTVWSCCSWTSRFSSRYSGPRSARTFIHSGRRPGPTPSGRDLTLGTRRSPRSTAKRAARPGPRRRTTASTTRGRLRRGAELRAPST